MPADSAQLSMTPATLTTLDPTSLSPDGRVVAVRTADGVLITDLDQDLEYPVDLPGVARVVALDREIVALTLAGAWRLHRLDRTGRPFGEPHLLPLSSSTLDVSYSRGERTTLLASGGGHAAIHLSADGMEVEVFDSGDDVAIPTGGTGRVQRDGHGLLLHRGTGKRIELPHGILRGTRLVGGATLLDGRLVALELRGPSCHRLLVVDLATGRLRNRYQLEGIGHVGFVPGRGHAVLGRRDGHIAIIDLAGGGCVRQLRVDGRLTGLACDAAGSRLAYTLAGGQLVVVPYALHLPRSQADEIDADRAGDEVTARKDENEENEEYESSGESGENESSGESGESGENESSGESGENEENELSEESEESEESDDKDDDRHDTPEPRAADHSAAILPARPLLALRPLPPAPPLAAANRSAYLTAVLGLVTARCRRAASTPSTPAACEAVVAAERRWAVYTADPAAPHAALAADLGLSSLAVELLWLIAAPQVWGELARIYRSLADAGAATCDELRLARLLDAGSLARADIARELEPDAPLVRTGAIALGAGVAPFVSLTADPAVIRRLRGDPVISVPPGIASRNAPAALDELEAPHPALTAVLDELARPAIADAPVRVVLRGTCGAGRRSIAAALAGRAGRGLGVIGVEGETDTVARLQARLAEVVLRGWLPCIDLAGIGDESPGHAAAAAVIAHHPGPLFLRCDPAAVPPCAPGYVLLDLPAPSITRRRILWDRALTTARLTADTARLASQFTATPGVIRGAVTRVAGAAPGGDATAAVVEALRQHRDARVAKVATRVTHLATWEQLVLAPDILESIHEMVARVRHRSRALEDWGFERVAATARSTTALFQGPPGTGKTLVAGAIARELGCELYRIDLSRVMSKWIGETEKNLATVFDIAEGGDTILLFDEADALFARRTEVKSSNDRYANVAVDYLLQRLDSFGGIAILTTNVGTSIDAAFRRRMSFRITFPLPDATDRERLWSAHIPPACPVDGDLGLAELAERYQMSGGYIRNAALRAAFLAASEDRPLSAGHLERAVRAEYRDLGHLHPGRLE